MSRADGKVPVLGAKRRSKQFLLIYGSGTFVLAFGLVVAIMQRDWWYGFLSVVWAAALVYQAATQGRAFAWGYDAATTDMIEVIKDAASGPPDGVDERGYATVGVNPLGLIATMQGKALAKPDWGEIMAREVLWMTPDEAEEYIKQHGVPW